MILDGKMCRLRENTWLVGGTAPTYGAQRERERRSCWTKYRGRMRQTTKSTDVNQKLGSSDMGSPWPSLRLQRERKKMMCRNGKHRKDAPIPWNPQTWTRSSVHPWILAWTTVCSEREKDDRKVANATWPGKRCCARTHRTVNQARFVQADLV